MPGVSGSGKMFACIPVAIAWADHDECSSYKIDGRVAAWTHDWCIQYNSGARYIPVPERGPGEELLRECWSWEVQLLWAA